MTRSARRDLLGGFANLAAVAEINQPGRAFWISAEVIPSYSP
jgi:hypothetical protein